MNPYSTNNLSLATVLSLYYPIVDIVPGMKGKDILFEDAEELREHVDLFWRKELREEPITLFNAEKDLKSRIRNS